MPQQCGKCGIQHRIKLQQLFDNGRFVGHEWRCEACGYAWALEPGGHAPPTTRD